MHVLVTKTCFIWSKNTFEFTFFDHPSGRRQEESDCLLKENIIYEVRFYEVYVRSKFAVLRLVEEVEAPKS